MTGRGIRSIVAQVAIVLFIVLGYFLIDFNVIYQGFRGKANFVTQASSCNLHKGSCKIIIQDGTSFELSVSSRQIPLLKPIKFLIKSNKDNLNNLVLDIYATNMFMGDFHFPIKNIGNGSYETYGVLPTCSVGNMKWNAEIRIEKIDKTIGARFQFKTDI